MSHKVFALSVEEVYDRHFDKCVTARLLAHCRAGGANKYLSREGRVVNVHVKLEKLVLGLSAHPLAGKVYPVSHVNHIIHACHLLHMGFVVHEIGVGLYGVLNGFEICAFFQ